MAPAATVVPAAIGAPVSVPDDADAVPIVRVALLAMADVALCPFSPALPFSFFPFL